MASTEPADQVHIFDTTLRDGEQSPGISLNTQEKVEIAQQLARLGVDVIEAGFPITSPGDFEAVEAIAREVEGPVICGLARTHKADIDAAWGAIKDSERPRIHTFISTSDIHIDPPAADHARGRQGAGEGGRGAGEVATATRSSSRPWTPPGPTSSSRPRSARSRSPRAPTWSTSRTPSATRRPRSTGATSPASTSWRRSCAGSSSRSTATTTSASRSPTPTPVCWPARDRSSARSTGSASARATARSRRS